ncbi:FecR domain-containing protein [Prosthecobacter fluviatilis]|uniref:FecR domain-containing protein n=1 Tax=Prosthecobacter fluviatilis TaxID=445931 RepID=A0ABW0KNU3_9BACT
MKQPVLLLSLMAVVQTTALTAGSITLSSGSVKTAGNQVTTGGDARAQATVDQRGSVVRLGSNTSAQVGDRGDVSLSKGVLLISSGDGFLRRPAVHVTTPQGEVTVRGSAIVAVLPDGSVKMTCLEGGVRGDLGGQSMALNPGHLIVQRPEGTRDTVQVNLNTLTHSSLLLDNASFRQPLAAAPEIRQEVAHQAQLFAGTLTLARSDSSGGSTQKITQAAAGEYKAAQAKSDSPGLLTRIFGIGASNSSAGNGTDASASTEQGGNPPQTQTGNFLSVSPGGTNLLRVSGEVSGSNVFLVSSGSSGSLATGSLSISAADNQTQRILTVSPNATTTLSNQSAPHLVLANGSTQQLVTQSSLTFSGNATVLSGATLTKAGTGTLTLGNSVQGATGVTVSSGSLVLQGPAAQQYLSGNLTVTGPGGAAITPTGGGGGVLTFQPTTTSTTSGSGTP